MSRTKGKGKRRAEGRPGSESTKNPQGQALKQANKKRKHEDQKPSQNTTTLPPMKKPRKQESSLSTPTPSSLLNGTPDAESTSIHCPPGATNSTTSEPTPINRTSSAETETNAKQNLLPPFLASLLAALSSYDVTTISILSSTQIQKRVSRTLNTLSTTYPTPTGKKPAVFLFYAKAAVVSKMISIVEIAKREIGNGGGKWFQYNAVMTRLEEREQRELNRSSGTGRVVRDREDVIDGRDDGPIEQQDDREEDEEEQEDGGFETMKTPFERAIEGKPKVRAVPFMIIYLSRVPVDVLRKVHREQTNSL